MKNDTEALALIKKFFGSIEKPAHFTDYQCCEECFEHDQLLISRNNDTLKIEDVGNIVWQPITYCSGEGFAYYMPALARLALSEPTYEYGWYGETLEIHLSFFDGKNRLYEYCNEEQRKAISKFMTYLVETRGDLILAEEQRDEFAALASKWHGDR
jgi:hypothetical protein